jgi:recombination protein RecR
MAGKDIEILVKQIAKLPSLGARSARRIVLHLLNKRESSFFPLIDALSNVAQNIKTCDVCGNFDTVSPCPICSSQTRDSSLVCVVRDVADLWAMERVSLFKGKYHVLGGVLSAMEGVVPEDLNIESLEKRIDKGEIKELVLALPATIDGQITSHYLVSRFKEKDLKMTTLAQGIPMGAELDYMDEGTIQLALNSRKSLNNQN